MVNEPDVAVPWRPRDIVLAVVTGLVLGFVLGVMGYAVSLAASLSDVTAFSIAMLLIQGGFLAGAYLVVVRRRGVSFKSIGFVNVPLTTVVLMVPLYIVVLMSMGLVISVTAPLLGEPPQAGDQLLGVTEVSLTAGETLSLLVVVAIVVPIVEELFFRGLIFGYLRVRFGTGAAVTLSSALFAVAHPFLALMPALFVLGLFLALVTQRYGSLYPAIALHALVNGVAVSLLAAS